MTWDWSPAELEDLQKFLHKHGICNGSVTTKPIGDGHSNLTFLVSDADRHVVLRRPPPPPVPPGAHDMLREARLIDALARSPVPVADVLAVSQAGEVLDVPFYVMSYVQGPVATQQTPQPLRTPQDRRQIGYDLIDTLAAIHDVDWRAVGLGDFGRPEGFNERHFRRMGKLIADDQGNPPKGFGDIEAWLSETVPTESGASIVHHDYRLGNVILGPERPGRITAVLDWELATIGDPLFDLGYFLASYPAPDEPLTPTTEMGTAVLEDGYPTRQELAQRYAALTGNALSNLEWYMTLALWKLAVLYEYGRRRAVSGRGDPYYNDPSMVQSFITAAHRTVGIDPPSPTEYPRVSPAPQFRGRSTGKAWFRMRATEDPTDGGLRDGPHSYILPLIRGKVLQLPVQPELHADGAQLGEVKNIGVPCLK